MRTHSSKRSGSKRRLDQAGIALTLYDLHLDVLRLDPGRAIGLPA
jgi:hypothetical protein